MRTTRPTLACAAAPHERFRLNPFEARQARAFLPGLPMAAVDRAATTGRHVRNRLRAAGLRRRRPRAARVTARQSDAAEESEVRTAVSAPVGRDVGRAGRHLLAAAPATTRSVLSPKAGFQPVIAAPCSRGPPPRSCSQDGLQPTQHEVVWRLPPQGDAEGPQPSSPAQHHVKEFPTQLPSALVAQQRPTNNPGK